jgi:CHAT domain-containing protein/Tfp pilus assembly protein PilF
MRSALATLGLGLAILTNACTGDAVPRALRAAGESLRARRWAEARAHLAEALRRQPESPRAHELLVQAMAGEHGIEAAVVETAAAAARTAGRPGPAYGHAFALYLAKSPEAPARLEAIVAAHPGYGAAYRLLAKIRLDAGDHQGALGLLREAVRRDPSYPDAHLALVDLSLGLGRAADLVTFFPGLPPEGQSVLRDAVASRVTALLEEGESLRRAGRTALARSHHLECARLLAAVGLGCASTLFLARAAHLELVRNAIPAGVRLLEESVRRCEAEGNWKLAAERLERLGAYRKMIGDFAGALAAFESAERHWRAAGDERRSARAAGHTGTELANLSRWDEAERAFDRGLAVARRKGDRDLEADLLVSAGNACGRRGAFSCAVRRLETAVRLRESQGDPGKLSTALTDLGKVLSLQGDLARAIPLLERAASLDKSRGDEAGLAGVLVNLGAAYRMRGDHVRALAMYRRAAQAFGSRPGLERFAAVAVANVGNVYRTLGQPERALTYHERALALQKKRGNRREIAETLQDIALDLSQLGRGEEAVARMREARRLFEEGGHLPELADSNGFLGWLLVRAGKYREGRALLEKALATQDSLGLKDSASRSLLDLALLDFFKEKRPAEALRRVARARDLARRSGLPRDWQSAYLEGLIREQGGDAAAALQSFAEAAAVVDEERRGLRAEAFKMSFLASRTFVYHRLARAALSVGSLETAWGAMERAKARGLLDLIETAGAAAGTGGAQKTLLDRQRFLAAQATWLQKRIVALAAGEEGRAQAERLHARRRKVLQELDDVRAEIRASDPMLAEVSRARPVSLDRVRTELLPPSAALLAYSVGEDDTILVAATAEGVAHHRIALGREALARRVAEYRERYLLQPEIRRPKGLIRDGRALYLDLVAPAEKILRGREIVVVPDGPLAYLPFEALVVEGDPERRTFTFLVERHAVFYAPSASVMGALAQRAHQRPPAREGFAAIGDPVYDHAAFLAKREEEAVSGARATRAGMTLPRTRAMLGRLPATALEVQRIGDLLPGPKSLLLRSDAREEKVKAGALAGHRFVHVATHGILNDNFQALALTLDPRSREDGFLELREIYGLRLDAELVVLSACQTGEGRLVSGEGIVGLTHAFLFAGAPRVVVSLWKVADASTAELMVEMYRRLGPPGAPGVARALQEAKLALLRGQSWSAPYYWAPFVAVGLPR